MLFLAKGLCKIFNKKFGQHDHLNELQRLRWSKVESFGINFIILPMTPIYPDVTSTTIRQVDRFGSDDVSRLDKLKGSQW